jgi:lipid A disaccharide synthetase
MDLLVLDVPDVKTYVARKLTQLDPDIKTKFIHSGSFWALRPQRPEGEEDSMTVYFPNQCMTDKLFTQLFIAVATHITQLPAADVERILLP